MRESFKARDVLNDEPDDWKEILAFDEETAAEKFAERLYNEEPSDTFEVEIMNSNNTITRWDVTVESEPTFHASWKK